MVVAHEGGHVKSRAQTRFTLPEKKFEPLVRFLGSPEPRKHAHRPQPTPVPRGMYSPQERKLARHPHTLIEFGVWVWQGGVEGIDRRPRNCRVQGVPLSGCLVFLRPFVFGFLERLLLRRFRHNRVPGHGLPLWGESSKGVLERQTTYDSLTNPPLNPILKVPPSGLARCKTNPR